MKKIKLLIVALLGMFLFSLTSCHTMSEANLYRKWANNGVELSKAHVYESISYNSLKKRVSKLSDDEIIYVFFGSPENSNSTTNVIVYNEQAIQYQIDTVYWLDSTSLSDKILSNIQDELGVKNSDKQGVLWSFKHQDGKATSIYFDGSKKKFEENGNSTNARICFTNLESEF